MNASALPFYNTLSKDGCRTLSENLKELSYTKDQIVHENGEVFRGMIYVKEGLLSVSLLSEDGREMTLFRLRKGEVCFLTAIHTIEGIHFDVSLETEQKTDLLYLPESILASLMMQNPLFAEFAHRSVAENFSRTVSVLQMLLFASLDQRLASFLYTETVETGSVHLSMTHERVAQHIGSAREVVSRALKGLAEAGIVRLSRARITVTNKEKLRKLAEVGQKVN